MSLRDYSETDDRVSPRNPWLYLLAVVFLAAILTVRLFYLQILNHHLYLDKSEDYRIKRVVVEAPRGFIYDRNGELLASNRMSYEVTVDPFERDSFDETLPRLATLAPSIPALFDVTPSAFADTVRALISTSRNPVTIVQDADFSTISVIEEHSLELPGVGCTIGQRRFYPHGDLACHVLGYMGKLSSNEAEQLTQEGYDRNQWIGKYGIERQYEPSLKGENGVRFLEKNYLNRFLGAISDQQQVPSEPGEDLFLTIDWRLQEAAEEAFGDSVLGSVVMLDPRTGEVLVMASAPTFDPNTFASIMTSDQYAAIVNDDQNPLYNRAIQGTYPPGSPFKVITALAGLENGIDQSTRFQPCDGTYYFGRTYRCWNWETGGHGSLDMIGAITQSCNVYMYQLSRRLGLDAWSETCGKFGFGSPTGIDLAGEAAGNLPSEEFYDTHNITWSPGMVLNLSIGQGENDVTPLQLAHYAGILATDGIVARPHLVRGAGGEPGQVEGISPESFRIVKEGMYGVVHGEQGTARSARVPGHEIAGKTGTAQNPHGEDHKIFIAFAPYENPTVAIACVAENVGHLPSSLAVSIGREVLSRYFEYYPDPTLEAEDHETPAR